MGSAMTPMRVAGVLTVAANVVLVAAVRGTPAEARAMLQKAADEDLRVYAVHFPFPGLGRVRKQGADFVWIPEQ